KRFIHIDEARELLGRERPKLRRVGELFQAAVVALLVHVPHPPPLRAGFANVSDGNSGNSWVPSPASPSECPHRLRSPISPRAASTSSSSLRSPGADACAGRRDTASTSPSTAACRDAPPASR